MLQINHQKLIFDSFLDAKVTVAPLNEKSSSGLLISRVFNHFYKKYWNPNQPVETLFMKFLQSNQSPRYVRYYKKTIFDYLKCQTIKRSLPVCLSSQPQTFKWGHLNKGHPWIGLPPWKSESKSRIGCMEWNEIHFSIHFTILSYVH